MSEHRLLDSADDDHTPGPWVRTGKNYIGQFTIGAPDARLGFVAAVDAEADAKLIEAAPDLYAVAKQIDMLWAVEWSTPEEADQILRTLITEVGDTARGAVAKVRGNSQ